MLLPGISGLEVWQGKNALFKMEGMIIAVTHYARLSLHVAGIELCVGFCRRVSK